MEIRLEFNVLGIIRCRHTVVDKEIHILSLPFYFIFLLSVGDSPSFFAL